MQPLLVLLAISLLLPNFTVVDGQAAPGMDHGDWWVSFSRSIHHQKQNETLEALISAWNHSGPEITTIQSAGPIINPVSYNGTLSPPVEAALEKYEWPKIFEWWNQFRAIIAVFSAIRRPKQSAAVRA